MNDNKVAHLRLIVDLLDQSNRTAAFAKRWGVSFAAVFLALGTQQPGFRVAYLAIFPIVFLWVLDAQNTRQDFLLHSLYDRVRKLPDSEVDFSLNLEQLPEAKRSVLSFVFAANPALFYLAMLVGIAVVDLLVA